MLERNDKVIRQKMMQYILPGIMLTAALQIGNIVDSMLVGNILGPTSMSAVKIGMSIDNIVEIPGYVLGVGGSVAVGVLLGNREVEKARRVFSSTMFISLVLGAIFCICSLGAGSIAEALCGGNSLTADAEKFIFVTLLIGPILNVALQMMNYVAVDCNPRLASAYVIVANVINLTFDFILLKYSTLGTAGAALSTGLGYGLGLFLMIFYVKSKKRLLSFVNPFNGFKKSIFAAVKAGLPTLCYMVSVTIADLSLNTMIVRMIGETAMTVYAVCSNVVLCVKMFSGGIVGLFSSMGSVLYGAGDFFGIRSMIRNLLRYSYIALGGIILFVVIKPDIFMFLFGVTNGEALSLGVTALRLYTIAMPFFLWNHFMMVYYQSTEKTALASLITTLQTCAVIVPAAFVFISIAKALGFNALNALILAVVFSEALTLLITFICQKVKYKGQSYFMIPKQDEGIREFTVCGNAGEISETIKMVFDFCEKQGVSRITANYMAVVAEEMLYNIFKHGGKHANNVDVSMHIEERVLHLRLIDNGIPFNPLEYKANETGYRINGIETVEKIASRMEYLRMSDLNCTMIEVNADKAVSA